MVPSSRRLAACAVLASCLAVMGATGCSSPELSPELSQLSVIAVRNPGFTAPAGVTYAMLPRSRMITSAEAYKGKDLDRLINDAIEQALEERGMRRVSSGSADVLVGWVGALDGDLDGQTVSQVFGMDPGLVPGGGALQQYGRGTVVMDVVRRGDRFPSWRGAVQAVAAPDLDESLRRQRIERGARLLVSEL